MSETPASRPLLALPGGLEIAFQTRTEARFFYEDIFEKEIYCRHGVSLDGATCVFDVGANIGMFTLFVSRKCPRAAIYAFEPAPPLFAILEANAGSYAPGARLFDRGVSNRAGTAELTFYLNSSGMSSFHADLDEEKAILESIMRHQLREGVEGMEDLLRHSDDLLEERFRAERFTCELTTLSRVIRDHRIDAIDLLKIDVQKSEAEVVEGLEAGDWKKIRQLVLEVHDSDDRLARMIELLRGKGFEVASEQDEAYEASNVHNLYAVRRQPAKAAAVAATPGLAPVAERSERLRAALEAQRGGRPNG